MNDLNSATHTKAERLVSNGDHERFSHYVLKTQATESYVMGTPVRALCGKVWVPSRDPNKYPICPECKKMYEEMADDLYREN